MSTKYFETLINYLHIYISRQHDNVYLKGDK